jgi:hypothetical protein
MLSRLTQIIWSEMVGWVDATTASRAERHAALADRPHLAPFAVGGYLAATY